MGNEAVVFDVEITEYGETRGNFPILSENLFMELLKTGNWTTVCFVQDGYKYHITRNKEIGV